MTTTTLPGNRVRPHLDRIGLERADIQQRVETFRQHQARQQAERERRWARVIAETRASLQAPPLHDPIEGLKQRDQR